MSIGRFRSALACISTELFLVATAAWASSSPVPLAVEVAAREMETELARTKDLYLVVDTARGDLSIRARGRTLESVPLRGVTAVHLRRPLRAVETPSLETPALLRVASRPAHGGRPLVAPARLVEAEKAPPPAGPAAAEPSVVPPAEYELSLVGGWRLEIVSETTTPSLRERTQGLFISAWNRATGRERSASPRIRIGLDPEDARRIHHLFRIDAPILLVLPPER